MASVSTAIATSEAAVIDVGSNSVRLVIYRVDGRALIPLLNEKVTAGLGRDLARTGKLSPEGAEAAERALTRFVEILKSFGISTCFPVATAAVRDAADGPAFVERVRKATGLKLRVLGGEEEARLSALGVLAGAPDANGLVGDLGGSSLELVPVRAGEVRGGQTYPLGPFALGAEDSFDYDRVAAVADAWFARGVPETGGDLYAVGGSWRALGRIAMALEDYPLHVLHHYEMTHAQALKVGDFVRRQSKRSLERLEEAAAKRADALPYAATVLERLLIRGRFERVVVSSFGLREGVLMERLDRHALETHPLLAGAEAFAGGGARARVFGPALARWIAAAFVGRPVVFSAERDNLLRAAAARLADIGGALHPDQRGELMFDLVLRAPLPALSHPERAFLAAAVHHRYTKSPPKSSEAYRRLLDEEGRRGAIAIGAALRLGADLSARSEALLEKFTLVASAEGLSLRIAAAQAALISEQAQRRLDALGAALGAPAKIVLV